MMFYKPRAGLNALHGVTWAIRLRRPLFRSGGSRENVASRGLDDTLPCPWFADYPHTVDLVGINAAEVFRKQKIQP